MKYAEMRTIQSPTRVHLWTRGLFEVPNNVIAPRLSIHQRAVTIAGAMMTQSKSLAKDD